MTPEPVVAVAATVDPLLSLFIGAFGAAILTVIAGFVGNALQSQREHNRWVRQQRVDAYLAFLRATELTWPSQSADQTVWRTYMDDMGTALGVVKVLGPDSVATAATAFFDTQLDVASAQRKVNGVEDGSGRKPELMPAFQVAAARAEANRAALIAAAREALNIKN